jgi:hypothetical protein
MKTHTTATFQIVTPNAEVLSYVIHSYTSNKAFFLALVLLQDPFANF